MNETHASLQTTDFVDELNGGRVRYILKKSQYVYNDTNRLVKLVEEMYDESGKKILTKTTQYVYNANGNQTSEYASFMHPGDVKLRRTIKGSVYGDDQPSNPELLLDRTLNTYDGFNRLKKAECMEVGIRTLAEYVYNGDDLRAEKTVKKSDNAYTPEITSFLYDRQHVILETDGSGNATVRYVHGINYIAKSAGAGMAYFLYNGHGDVVQTVTEAGDVQNEYDYDIFGNPMLTIEATACSIRYVGEYFDNETGLYYLRAIYNCWWCNNSSNSISHSSCTNYSSR